MIGYLPFEKPVEALALHAASLRQAGGREPEAAMLDERAGRQLADLYSRLTPWQRTQVARHPARPHFGRIVAELFDDIRCPSTPAASSTRWSDGVSLGLPTSHRSNLLA